MYRKQTPLELKAAMEARRLGCVKWFSHTRGYGFVQDMNGGEDAFVHFSSLKRRVEGWRGLFKGEYVSYIPQAIDGHVSALDVTGVDGGVLMCEAYDAPPSRPSPAEA